MSRWCVPRASKFIEEITRSRSSPVIFRTFQSTSGQLPGRSSKYLFLECIYRCLEKYLYEDVQYLVTLYATPPLKWTPPRLCFGNLSESPDHLSIFGQCSYFTPPENTRNLWFSGVFRGYKMGTLARNGLITVQDKFMNFKTASYRTPPRDCFYLGS